MISQQRCDYFLSLYAFIHHSYFPFNLIFINHSSILSWLCSLSFSYRSIAIVDHREMKCHLKHLLVLAASRCTLEIQNYAIAHVILIARVTFAWFMINERRFYWRFIRYVLYRSSVSIANDFTRYFTSKNRD